MLNPIIGRDGEIFPHDPVRRGYHVVYRSGEVNHCPGCGRSHWIVGRLLAECAFCGTAMPLSETGMIGVGTFLRGAGAEPEYRDAA
jgi:hypothetical protein